MNTNKTKNVLFIVLIAVVSSVVTLFGYNVINRNSRSLNETRLVVHTGVRHLICESCLL
jgi:CHASE3 domain sensor protein